MKQRKLAIALATANVTLKSVRESLKAKFTLRNEKLEAVKDAETTDEIKKLEKELEDLDAEIENLKKEEVDAEKIVEDLENELDEAQDLGNDNEEKNGGQRSMKINKNKENKLSLERAGVNNYIRSKGQIREGFTSVDGEAIIPVDVNYKPTLEKGNNNVDLTKYVRVVKVKTPSGNYPILEKTKTVFSTVEELEKNPTLAKPTFLDVKYEISTYRGAIPISKEAIDDAEIDLAQLVENHIELIGDNTKNKAILTVLKTFTKKQLTTVDEIKNIKNVQLDPAYNKMFIMSQTFYDKVDTLKDKNGKYLFQESLVSPTGKTFLGIAAEVVKDTDLGNANQATAFLGDVHEAVTIFDRKQLGVRWADHDIYGQYLQGGLRMDVKKTDANAGFYITATDLVVVPEEEVTP